MRPPALEFYFYTELYDSAWRIDAVDHAESRIVNVGIGNRQACVVEGIERLASKLDCQPFHNREILEKREVEIIQTRSANIVAAFGSKCPLSRLSIGGRVEPLTNAFVELGRVRVPNQVAALTD